MADLKFKAEPPAASRQTGLFRVSLRVAHEKIRRVSIDKFYEIVTGDPLAFKKLCMALPKVIEDVVASIKLAETSNTVLTELKAIDKNLLKSIYLLSFRKYEGFHDFNI